MRKFRSLLAVLLSTIMILSSLTVFTAISAFADVAVVNYTFASNDAGYAEGVITVTPTTGNFGTYYLYWADDNNALDEYQEIASLSISSGSKSYDMPKYTVIPPDATKVIAVKASSEPDVSSLTVAKASGVYSIPSSKRLSFNSEDVLYTFGSVGDPQLANDSYGSGTYPYDEIHLEAAFETLAKRGVDFIVSSGDTVNDQNGNQTYAAEYKRYQKILADSSYVNPIYEAIGNHELWAGTDKIGIPAFIKGTGLDSTTTTISNGKAYYEITEPVTGDHFIFMALEGTFYTDEGTQFSKEQLDWLENLLEKYNNDGKNIFIIEHGNIAGWGSGDKESAPYYYDLGLNKESSDVKRFISLMETYKECVIITAHTHLELSAQLNYSDNDGTSAVMIHNSAIGGVRRLVNGSIDRSPVLGLSEGYIVEVYKDCILFNGINLYYNEIMPSCSYIIPFKTSLDDEDTTVPTTENPTEEPTTPEIEYLYGDTDLNGKISISDATLIQCVAARTNSFANEKAKIQADLDGDGVVDVQDATLIQMYLVELISSFPIEDKAMINSVIEPSEKSVGSSSFSEVLNSAKDDLDAYYTFSSYDQYMALKKAYLAYTNSDLNFSEQDKASEDILSKQQALYAIAGSRPIDNGDEITIYFSNNKNWSTVKAYVWGSSGKLASWPGTEMTYVETNSLGEKIYSITFSYDDYQNIIFTNGSKQTVDIALEGKNNIGYYISGESNGKYTCLTYDYS